MTTFFLNLFELQRIASNRMRKFFESEKTNKKLKEFVEELMNCFVIESVKLSNDQFTIIISENKS